MIVSLERKISQQLGGGRGISNLNIDVESEKERGISLESKITVEEYGACALSVRNQILSTNLT